ncbi:MAG: hypothetical protein BGO12_10775 [Verrucomicrobia bacterium 61-8]|nr:MAG: hypothetical protein BGO12_10775 [Verrucomicrobia bacterium 61-8]
MNTAELRPGLPAQFARFELQIGCGVFQRIRYSARALRTLKFPAIKGSRFKKHIARVHRIRQKCYKPACNKTGRIDFFQPQPKTCATFRNLVGSGGNASVPLRKLALYNLQK